MSLDELKQEPPMQCYKFSISFASIFISLIAKPTISWLLSSDTFHFKPFITYESHIETCKHKLLSSFMSWKIYVYFIRVRIFHTRYLIHFKHVYNTEAANSILKIVGIFELGWELFVETRRQKEFQAQASAWCMLKAYTQISFKYTNSLSKALIAAAATMTAARVLPSSFGN